MRNPTSIIRRTIVVLIVMVLMLSASVLASDNLPDMSSADLSATWTVLVGTYSWLGDRSGKPDVDRCDLLKDSRQLLESMIVLHEYYSALGDESATLQELNVHINRVCLEPQDPMPLGNETVIDVPTPLPDGGGTGGGIVNIPTNDLALAFLSMNEEQREVYLEQVSPESAYALRAWISENYDAASVIAEVIGEASDMETTLPPNFESPPSFEEFIEPASSFEPVGAFPEIESPTIEPYYDLPQIIQGVQDYVFELYPQLREVAPVP